MSSNIIQSFTSYFLMPLLVFIFIGIGYIISKKNQLLNNRKVIWYLLLTAIILAIPGLLGFIGYQFMPYVYLSLQAVYFLLGCLNIKIMDNVLFKKDKSAPFYLEVILHLLAMFSAAALFSLAFNYLNELQYGLWASTCLLLFILPCLFRKTYRMYLNIPLEIYKEWTYSRGIDLSHFDSMDYNKLLVLELELFKNPANNVLTKIKAKAPDNIPFGIWFQKFLTDYNVKFPLEPISINSKEGYYSWIFYTKPSIFRPRHYIDCELSIADNKIKERDIIIAKRVSNMNK